MSKVRPSHGLFIKWGRFQIGAFGQPAVLTVLGAVVAAFLSRLGGCGEAASFLVEQRHPAS